MMDSLDRVWPEKGQDTYALSIVVRGPEVPGPWQAMQVLDGMFVRKAVYGNDPASVEAFKEQIFMYVKAAILRMEGKS